MKTMWKLENKKFIKHFFLQGPIVEDVSISSTNENQLEFEAEARKEVAMMEKNFLPDGPSDLSPGEFSKAWNLYFEYGNDFIEKSDFYSTLKKITMHAHTFIYSEIQQTVQFRIWSYMAVSFFVNKVNVANIDTPVYKPINYIDITLTLDIGFNEVYLNCVNLGVRDTRNIVGIQLMENETDLYISVSRDQELQKQIYLDTRCIETLDVHSNQLKINNNPHGLVSLYSLIDSPDYYHGENFETIDLDTEKTTIQIKDDVKRISFQISNPPYKISREIEFANHIKPEFRNLSVDNEHVTSIFNDIASIKSLNRRKFGFSIMNILARKYLGISTKEDQKLFQDDLDLIEKRVDCSDFLVAGLLRYVKNYSLSDNEASRIKEVLLNYRYWMDMDGADGMCFWSENHSLMFFSSAYIAGTLYPDDYFIRANMKGSELASMSEKRLHSWLKDVEEHHLEEFLSADYSSVTFAALLNVVDFTTEDLSQRATRICDEILHSVALHTFQGSVIAPMGRVYRGVLYPYNTSVQAMVNLIDPSSPKSFGEGWLAHLATSKYIVPESLQSIITEDYIGSHFTGNAEIKLQKTADYCLTSVQSPRSSNYERWNIVSTVKKNEGDIQDYVKSLNERFHGTTNFSPGIYGYQQHLWTAALSNEAFLFVNHPGSSTDITGLRPGYWYGNGIIPAIKQELNIIGSIYKLKDNHPIKFTHIYCPLDKFDDYKIEQNWILVQKHENYLALWSSNKIESYNDTLFNCEFRVYGERTAYLCFSGSKQHFNSIEEFGNFVKAREPLFDQEQLILKTNEYRLEYKEGHDDTQYIL